MQLEHGQLSALPLYLDWYEDDGFIRVEVDHAYTQQQQSQRLTDQLAARHWMASQRASGGGGGTDAQAGNAPTATWVGLLVEWFVVFVRATQ